MASCDFGSRIISGAAPVPGPVALGLELVGAGSLRPELLASEVVTFEDAPEALLEPHTKLVMVPS